MQLDGHRLVHALRVPVPCVGALIPLVTVIGTVGLKSKKLGEAVFCTWNLPDPWENLLLRDRRTVFARSLPISHTLDVDRAAPCGLHGAGEQGSPTSLELAYVMLGLRGGR